MLEQGYWLIPNAVLYSTEISDKQKLLFCVISSLCAEKWFCWATNEYLSQMLDVHKMTISKNISDLKEKGFINVEIDKDGRKITLSENAYGGLAKTLTPYILTNITNEYYSFQNFRKDYPHARKWKKAESKKYFLMQNPLEVKKQVSILKRKVKAWIQDAEFVPACERWIRDFTPLSEDVVNQDLVKICKWHLNAWGDVKQRAIELKETFWEEEINRVVKSIQQKDSPKNLFLKQQ